MMRCKFLALCFLVLACGKVQRIDTDKIKDAVEHRKVKRITENQIQTLVEQKGEKIAALLRTRGICNNEPLLDSLEAQQYVKISVRTEADTKNNNILPKEREILDAYAYNLEKGLSNGDNIQKLNDSLILYTSPIKPCTGKPSKINILSIQFSKKDLIRNTTIKELKGL